MSGQARVVQLDDLVERTSHGIVSRVLHESDQARVGLFTFNSGEQLTEHRASFIDILPGAAQIVRGQVVHEVPAGTWVYMLRDLPHAIRSMEPLTMPLTLLRSSRRHQC